MNNYYETAIHPYRDPARSIDERVDDLLSRMTVEEKVAQMGSVWVYQVLKEEAFDDLLAQGIGHITRLAGASSLGPIEAATLANHIQRYLLQETRLGIPAIVHEECISGYMARDATCFPQIIGLASTWNPQLAQDMAAVVRHQMRAVGAHQGLSPVLDVSREPRWGRIEETFGEDPYLVSRMGVAFVQGLQGDDPTTGVAATPKHFVGYGAPDGGMNWNPAHLSSRELREVFMQPFEAAVREANVLSLMNAYNELDGIPCGASRELLTDILRGEWGFAGVLVSDYFAIDQMQSTHRIAGDSQMSARLALNAGIDVELPATDCYGEPLLQAVRNGAIDEALVDLSVRRILALKFRLGLFENPYVDADTAAAIFDTPAQRDLARTIAQQSMVLLKNDNHMLPLSKNLRSIAVIGPNADNVRHMIGDYAYPCHIESLAEMKEKGTSFNNPIPDSIEMVDNFVPIASVLEGIRAAVSAETTIRYAKGCDVLGDDCSGIAAAVEAAQQAEIAIVVVGDKSGLTDSCTSGEARDRVELGLTGVQLELIQAVQATGTPVVVVLVNGRPLSLPWVVENVPAMLEAWLPGEEGAAAIAGVLFGDVNPGGKLPVTVPAHVGQLPVFHYRKPSGGQSFWKESYVEHSNKPLFPFGYGLSYTTFELGNLRVSGNGLALDGDGTGQIAIGDTLAVQVDVCNTGERAGDEVVQLYTRSDRTSVTRPVQELRGFKRVSLAPGESKTIRFILDTHQLAFYDREMCYVVEPGPLTVMVGTTSDDFPLQQEVTLIGSTQEVTEPVFGSEVQVVAS